MWIKLVAALILPILLLAMMVFIWTIQDKQSLLLKLKPWLGIWYRTGKIRISPGKRELIEEILNEKLSTAKN